MHAAGTHGSVPLKVFFGETGVYAPGGVLKNLDDMAYAITTIEQRKKMDMYPEIREHDADIHIVEMPDPKKSKKGGIAYATKTVLMRKTPKQTKRNAQ